MRKTILLFFIVFSMDLMGQSQNCNCCTENHRAFDFWIGSWTVTNANGTTVGTNVIKKVQNECVLQENWTSAQVGYTGTSFNFYNTQTKLWEQLWLDNKGGSLKLKGNRKDNQMILQSDKLKNKKGEPYINRITWTHNEDGTVRQLWEVITNGTEIAIVFDGLYKKLNNDRQ